MRRPAVERGVELALEGRPEDHLAERPRMVVDVTNPGSQPIVVEGRRAAKANLLLGREEQLDPAVWTVLRDDESHRFEHRGDGRLVVGAEDRSAGVAKDTVLEHRL